MADALTWVREACGNYLEGNENVHKARYFGTWSTSGHFTTSSYTSGDREHVKHRAVRQANKANQEVVAFQILHSNY